MRALALVSLVAACGPSAGQVKKAKLASYQADFAVVWNAVTDVVKNQYRFIILEDPIKGQIRTDWHIIERAQRDDTEDGTGTAPQPGNPTSAGDFRSAKIFRVAVKMSGGPPYSIKVEGEAARFEPGMAVLMPYGRGAIDEPKWVEPRIDNLYVAIYERLEKYAVIKKEAPVHAPKKELDTTPWANLPSDAAIRVAEVRDSAVRKKPDELAPYLADPITLAVGPLPREQAIAIWNADLAPLVYLRQALDGGCQPEADAIVCPKQPGATRVVFRRVTGVWKLAEVVTEDVAPR